MAVRNVRRDCMKDLKELVHDGEVGEDAEKQMTSGAIRTDFILSAEIMVIALKEVITEPVVTRGVILAVVGVGITAVVYGVVALIVKMDDVGLALAGRDSPPSQRLGRMLVAGMLSRSDCQWSPSSKET